MDAREFEAWASVEALNKFRDMIRTAGFILTREPGNLGETLAGDETMTGETIAELRRTMELCDRYRAFCQGAIDRLQSETRGRLN